MFVAQLLKVWSGKITSCLFFLFSKSILHIAKKPPNCWLVRDSFQIDNQTKVCFKKWFRVTAPERRSNSIALKVGSGNSQLTLPYDKPFQIFLWLIFFNTNLSSFCYNCWGYFYFNFTLKTYNGSISSFLWATKGLKWATVEGILKKGARSEKWIFLSV